HPLAFGIVDGERLGALGTLEAGHDRFSVGSQPLAWRAYLRRSASLSSILRRRMAPGVTSTNSSSSIYSSANSSVTCRGGLRRIVFSEVAARTLVSFFSRQTLTGKSLSRQCSPAIWPS